jgi:integrase
MSIRVRQYANKKSYQASLRLRGRRLTKNFDRKSDAEKWLRSKLERREVGELSRVPQIILSDFSKEWFPNYRLHVKPCTERNAERILRNWILPMLGQRRLDQISPQDVKRLLSAVLEKGRCPRTANYVMATLRKLLNDAINEWGYSFRNPVCGIRPLQEGTHKVNFWTRDETFKFLKVVENLSPSELILYKFLLNTGARIGEACALHWEDVDLNKGLVCIRRNMDWKTLRTVESTKSGKLRYVGLNDNLRREIEAHYTMQVDQGRAKLVFGNAAGNPRSLSNIYRRSFLKCIEIAGVSRIRTKSCKVQASSGSFFDGPEKDLGDWQLRA